jgi:hypothetical protein
MRPSLKQAAEDNRISNHTAYSRDHEYYPYRSHGQVFRAVYGLAFSIFLIFFTGWQSFAKPFDRNEFVASYISVCPSCRCPLPLLSANRARTDHRLFRPHRRLPRQVGRLESAQVEKVGVDAAGAAAAHGRRSWAPEGPACLPES